MNSFYLFVKKHKRTTIATLLFSFVFLVIPQLVDGWVLDLAMKQVEALSERIDPFFTALVLSIIFYIVGTAVLRFTTELLTWVINITPEALIVTGGEGNTALIANIVQGGWGFMVGIVNVVLIIAFIVIAFSTILGIEKIQFKKTLPNLIIVALLVNFTLLFVGAGIDISNILFNTVAGQFLADGGRNILYESIKPLLEISVQTQQITAAYLIALVAKLALPYVSTAVIIGEITTAIPIMIPLVSQYLIFGTIMFLLSGMFLLFFLVFLSRIFIIQILAIVAPLAFFCLIFPNTKKYWDQWLQHLVQWLFVGVVLIFLMFIGLALAPLVARLGNIVPIP